MKIYSLALIILLFNYSCLLSAPSGHIKNMHGGDEDMCLVPGGEFDMGIRPNPNVKYVDNELHRVKVDSFFMDKYEVTNAQYLEFCEATGHKLPEFWGMDVFYSGPDFPHHPVVGVTWTDAMAFAQWKGKRLPTEAEWEYAARGGLAGKNYPNGNNMTPRLGNYNGTQGHAVAVGTFPPNGYDLYDMSGNVVEWVLDFYAKDYYLNGPQSNPRGPETGKRRVIRGGGWRSGKMCATVDFRQSLRPNWVDFNVGFRCAKDIR